MLLHYCIDFPFIHNLRVLAGLLPSEVTATPTPALAEASALTTYAVATRYPWSSDNPVESDEYDKAIRIADAVVQWAAAVIDEPHQRAGEDE